MSDRLYLKGNEALAYGSLKARMEAYFAYPITPSSEIAETFAKEFNNPEYPDYKLFLQASSEIEAINLVLGAASTGARVMTATASPGFSLKQEGISYGVGMELPFVVANVNRGGPGLGSLGPEQSDYFQVTKGGGHGGYKMVVLAPSTVQEMASYPQIAFDLAFKYRNPVMLFMDAFTGQIKEDIIFPEITVSEYDLSWSVGKGKYNILNSLHLDLEEQELHQRKLFKKYDLMRKNEVRYEAYRTDDAEILIVAFGIVARIAKSAVNHAREEGIKAGLLRPITLFPYPYEKIASLTPHLKHVIVAELNSGLMKEDVLIALNGRVPASSLLHAGGVIHTEKEVYDEIIKYNRK
ncbi:MAG: 3-methyl-2-oxobutanoate dehydrogenase subunit VorB [Candidatus Thermoplasmatota archaeon]|nr:3-methyl-2-oxobutanoate dehydrogenase subunit VorB [Candidatus Thermoplasmatota archaeon]MCL5963618.1 3-methyl-2-oxobutanoate dehydrogenase subunit VorB [Candidatus Thermoplasmatota archaeon]